MKKKEEEEIVKLLKEALTFINFVPNKPYRGGGYTTSYQLASDIEKFFDRYNNGKKKI